MQTAKVLSLAAIFALTALFAGAADKKNAKADAQAQQRAAEAAEEDALNIESALRMPILRGTFVMNAEDSKDNPRMIGTFTVGTTEYRVEVSREALRSELQPLDRKVVSLAGKIRDGGKTFIVQTVERGGPPPAAFSNPRGL